MRIRERYHLGPSMSLYSALVALDGDTRSEVGAGIDTRGTRYAIDAAERGHLHVATRHMVVIASSTVVGVWTRDVVVAAAVGLVVGVLCRRRALIALAVVLAVFGALRSERSWLGLAPDRLGPFEGWVRLVDDPQPYPSSTRVIVEVDGERFELWSRGRAQQLRIGEWRGGEWVRVSGRRVALDAERSGRVAWQHVVGELRLDWASDVWAGGAVARASNRVREAIERAGDALPGADGPLFRGLVVGDDREQPRAMIERFRASGLSHLTAVSGQNVSFVLAASGPLLRRLRPWARWAATVGLIAWFVALTRFEPSIVRAGVMAGLSATAFVLGRERAPVRILAVAVIGLVLIDPLLVWSIGFWLSVGATLGVSSAGPWIARRIESLDPTRLFALPIGVTLGAQLGVVVPSVLVFGRLPLVSIPANLLAVPVAGAVMLYGMPAGLIAGWCPPLAPVLMFPARLGTRWVDTVASVGARIEPGPSGQIVGWILVAVAVGVLLYVASRRDALGRCADSAADS
ncbi:putative competence protein ComEC [Ilumatobacter coccineus YM16-304]|uniref:Putative competence protein ComEC n=2 Tax=Ilumatobacter coccineus TaxID=467094 RepID=A0A6C7EEK7_ILUCY|nr:putative competence protein ComEC [Ilumatobacter coccineus YM16-304]